MNLKDWLMLEKFLESDIFVHLMRVHVNETIDLLLQEGVHFSILVNLDGVYFEPEPPKEVTDTFKPIISFALSGYTFESAKVYDNILQFEAGFGRDNIGSLVNVHLDKILQISIDKTPILINLSIPKQIDEDEQIQEEKEDDEGIDKSMKAMLSNPENQKFLKK